MKVAAGSSRTATSPADSGAWRSAAVLPRSRADEIDGQVTAVVVNDGGYLQIRRRFLALADCVVQAHVEHAASQPHEEVLHRRVRRRSAASPFFSRNRRTGMRLPSAREGSEATSSTVYSMRVARAVAKQHQARRGRREARPPARNYSLRCSDAMPASATNSRVSPSHWGPVSSVTDLASPGGGSRLASVNGRLGTRRSSSRF